MRHIQIRAVLHRPGIRTAPAHLQEHKGCRSLSGVVAGHLSAGGHHIHDYRIAALHLLRSSRPYGRKRSGRRAQRQPSDFPAVHVQPHARRCPRSDGGRSACRRPFQLQFGHKLHDQLAVQRHISAMERKTYASGRRLAVDHS